MGRKGSKKKKSAINTLNNYIFELNAINNRNEGEVWKSKVIDSLRIYLGDNSALIKKLDEFVFTDKIQTIMGTIGSIQTTYNFNPDKKRNFKNALEQCISHINANGIKEDYIKTNFLSQFTTLQILGGISAIGAIVFSAGWYIGGSIKDHDLLKTEDDLYKSNRKILSLEDSLKIKKQENKNSIDPFKHENFKTNP